AGELMLQPSPAIVTLQLMEIHDCSGRMTIAVCFRPHNQSRKMPAAVLAVTPQSRVTADRRHQPLMNASRSALT
ncbi:MAG: hypothetical protein KGI75_30155, partial [Rhizobiaceae bacterium]|nr:hypothetical protein [Rhizobiaceae bacterium]